MKKNKLFRILFSALMVSTLVACDNEGGGQGGEGGQGGGGSTIVDNQPFSFSVALASGRDFVEVGQTDTIVVTASGSDQENRTYNYDFKKQIITLSTMTGPSTEVTGVSTGTVLITVTETRSKIKQLFTLSVVDSYQPASGGFNYASSSGAEAIAKRTEILGKLEKYAVESHLTGITLFENGGYAKYSSRLEIPTEDYITGYGFGILSEGNIEDDLPGATDYYKRYYHSAQTQNPGKINAMDDTGSQVSGLSGYITSTYWGTKMNATKNGYEWYPVLAKDTTPDGKANNRPVPVYEGAANPLGLYKRWRIYVKTGADGLKYRTNGVFKNALDKNGRTWDNRPVEIEDYEFPIKMLLTGANQLVRGSEMAGDKTTGIKGAQTYFNRTKNADITQSKVDEQWESMKASGELGFTINKAESYIEFELVREIDDFTAMYTLSSALYSPIPQEFVQMLGNGEVKNGAKVYGEKKENYDYKGVSYAKLEPVDTTLSLGAYYLEHWEDQFVAFRQDENWIERTKYPNRNRILGIKITTYKSATENPDALYEEFYADKLDSCGVPSLHITDEKIPSKKTDHGKTTRTLVTKGDSTFKLNVNSCTQERWDYLFGRNGKICVTDDASKYNCKPWMSNDNFLNGLYWSINRKEFADKQGAQPSIDYFSNAYLSDPENGISYNSTQAHKDAVAKMHNVVDGKDDYGFNTDIAIDYFKAAYEELKKAGKIKDGPDADHPTIINIQINWMYQNDINEYGTMIKQYFEKAFNNTKVSGGKVKLVVEQPNPSSDWQAVYNEVMMKGKFDLAFGAISGNTYNPLNFLEVLKSDNSSGFTLNWGTDTSAVDEKRPIVYEDQKWSFDALWMAADRGGIVDEGKAVNPIKTCYLNTPKNLDGTETNFLYQGFTVSIPMEFTEVENVSLDVAKLALYVVNGNTYEVTYNYDKANKVINVTVPAATAAAIEQEIGEVQKKNDPNKQGYIEHPFSMTEDSFWYFELTYTLSIKGGTPSATTVAVAMTKDQQEYK